jgi:tetratricopeptide (TPR) repeat protein
MTTRLASSSLRSRFIWTGAVVAIIALVSAVAIVAYRTAQREVLGSPEGRSTDVAAKPVLGGLAAASQSADFHSRQFGYGVRLAGSSWTAWDDLAEVVPEAEFGALLNGDVRFLVIPVSLLGLEPRTEALDHALLARLGIAWPGDPISDFDSVQHGDASGHSFQVARTVAGAKNTYHVEVLRHGGCAYLAAAWIDQSKQPPSTDSDREAADMKTDAALNDVFRRFEFDSQAAASPPVDELTTSQRKAHATIFNDLGQFADSVHDYTAAIDSYRLAFELQPDDPAILTNLVNARIERKQFRQALDDLEPNIGRFANEPDLLAGRAYLLSELNQTAAALDAYSALFASGYRAEAPFTQYVTLLADNDRASEALNLVRQYLLEQDSYAIRRLEASLERKLGNQERAIAKLTALLDKQPFSAEVAYDLADCYWAADRFEDSLEVCRQLLEHHYDTAVTFWLQARNQYSLKQYAGARRSLEAVLKREPAHDEARKMLSVVNAASGQ